MMLNDQLIRLYCLLMIVNHASYGDFSGLKVVNDGFIDRMIVDIMVTRSMVVVLMPNVSGFKCLAE